MTDDPTKNDPRGRELTGAEADAALRDVLADALKRNRDEGFDTAPALAVFDLIAHLRGQREWSARTFGPSRRTRGVLDHIRKELGEIERAPLDLSEWIDVVILAFDGAWRAGHEPEQIAWALSEKQARNEARTWPDWRGRPEDEAIEHDRAADPEGGATRFMVDRLWQQVEERARFDAHMAALLQFRRSVGAEHGLLVSVLSLADTVARMTDLEIQRIRNTPARLPVDAHLGAKERE